MSGYHKAHGMCATGFLRDESGSISVDWAVMAAVVAALSVAAAGSLSNSTIEFENRVEATLKNNVSNVQATSQSGSRTVGSNDTGDVSDGEFGFAGISPVTSTSSSRVQCDSLVAECGRSAETIQEQFLMTDGSVWIRTTTTYTDDDSTAVVWLDDTGRETLEVPDLPSDLPVVAFN